MFLQRAVMPDNSNLKVTFDEKQNSWVGIENNQSIMVLVIEADVINSDFFLNFCNAVNSAKNLFLIDVVVKSVDVELFEKTLKNKQKDIKNSVIIQLNSTQTVRVYIKEISKEIVIIKLKKNKVMEKAVLENELIEKHNISFPFLVEALKAEVVGKFTDSNNPSLRNIEFYDKQFETWKLIDYAVYCDEFLTTRFLSMHDWILNKCNEDKKRTLEIAAEHATENTLAALLSLRLPPSKEETLKVKKILELKDSINCTPLFIALKKGKLKNVIFFLDCGADLKCDGINAIDIAWKENYFEVVQKLLENDSEYPEKFTLNNQKKEEIENALGEKDYEKALGLLNLEKINLEDNKKMSFDSLWKFLSERHNFHTSIKKGSLKEVKQYILKYQSRFYLNEAGSARFTAVESKQFKIYAFLMSEGIDFKNEKEKTCINSLDGADLLSANEAISKYFKPLDGAHVLFLISKSKPCEVKNSSTNEPKESKEIKIKELFEKLDSNEKVSIILKVLQFSDLKEIVFDFYNESIEEINFHSTNKERGICKYLEGKIIIAVKNISDDELLGVLAHELTHYAMYVVYNNHCNPYSNGDENEGKFKVVVNELQLYCEASACDYIIASVFVDYKENLWPGELIVRVPHMLAKYGIEKGKCMLQQQAKQLLTYFDQNVLASFKRFIKKSYLFWPRSIIRNLNDGLKIIPNEKKFKLKENIKFHSLVHFLTGQEKKIFLLVTKSTTLSRIYICQKLQELKFHQESYLIITLKHFEKEKDSIETVCCSEVLNLLVMIFPPNLKPYELKTGMKTLCSQFLQRNKKIIFIIDEENAKPFKEKVMDLKNDLFDKNFIDEKDPNEFTLNDVISLDEEINFEEKILQKEITFQGERIKVKQMIGKDKDRTKKTEFNKLIRNNILVKLLQNENLKVGKKIFKKHDKKLYIKRKFRQKIEIDTQLLLKANGLSDIGCFAISGDNKEKLERLLFPTGDLKADYDINKSTEFVILDQYDEDAHFERLSTSGNIHWLNFQNMKLLQHKSRGLEISSLSQLTTTTGQFISERELIKMTNKDHNKNVIIISDSAGTGKTKVITSLAKSIKKQSLDEWLIIINQNDCTEWLKDLPDKNNFGINEAEIFLSAKVLKLSDQFEKDIFKYQLRLRKVKFMLDGFDEIDSANQKKIVAFIKILIKNGVKQVWLTSRPNMKAELENEFQQFSFALGPFSKKDQQKLLIYRFSKMMSMEQSIENKSEKINIFSVKLIEEMGQLLRSTNTCHKIGKKDSFTSNPFHIYMLALVFKKKIIKFCLSNNQDPNSYHINVDLIKVYEKFFYIKWGKHQQEKKAEINKFSSSSQSNTSDTNIYNLFESMAFKSLFGEEKSITLIEEQLVKIFDDKHPSLVEIFSSIDEVKKILFKEYISERNSFVEKINNRSENHGIIDKIKNDYPEFTHQTYAEYLVAKYFIGCLLKPELLKTSCTILIQHVLIESDYRVVRSFIDNYLGQEEKIVERKKKEKKLKEKHFKVLAEITSTLNKTCFLEAFINALTEYNKNIVKFLLCILLHLDIELMDELYRTIKRLINKRKYRKLMNSSEQAIKL